MSKNNKFQRNRAIEDTDFWLGITVLCCAMGSLVMTAVSAILFAYLFWQDLHNSRS